jgi:two-component system, cell cycle sensor histidine kinase and response regulator CckA
VPKDKMKTRSSAALRGEAERFLSDKPGKTLPHNDHDRLIHELEVHQVELEMQNEELRRTGLEVDESREKYVGLYDLAPVGYLTLGERGMISELNLTAASLLGIKRKSLIDKPFHRFIKSEFQDVFYLHQQKVSDSSTKQTCDVVLKKNDGTFFQAQLDSIGMEVEGQRLMRTVLTDITERKQAEEALRESERRLQALMDAAPVAICWADTEGNWKYCNQKFHELFGYALEEIPSSAEWRRRAYPDPAYRETVPSFIEAYKQGKELTPYEVLIRCKNGSQRHVILSAAVVSDRIVLVLDDITEQKHLESQLRQAQKLESLGILAGGIAHDFNNLMTVVLGNVELAIMGLPQDHKLHPRLEAARGAAWQTKDLTSRLITFSRGGFPVKQVSAIAEVLQEGVQQIVKGTAIQVSFDIEKNLWPAEVDRAQMGQVFYNLAANAVEAMPDGGTFTVKAENAEIPLTAGLPLREGSYIRIAFADNGRGIPEEHLSRIFDPYFTTKDMGQQKGMGLGLSICYSVLKKHGGHIGVASKPGKGTTFTLHLPALVQKIEETAQSLSSYRVLIMEDEAGVREVERTFLERLGYEVIEVRDGQEAVDRYKETLLSNNPFSLVILDLVVPQGLGGQLTMERLQKEDPSIRAIIVSGYVDDPVMEHHKDYGFRAALKKPFRFDEFDKAVRTAIGEEE